MSDNPQTVYCEQNCARKSVRQSARRGFSRYQTTLSPEATLKIYLIVANWCLKGSPRGLVQHPMGLKSDVILCSLQTCQHSADFAEFSALPRHRLRVDPLNLSNNLMPQVTTHTLHTYDQLSYGIARRSASRKKCPYDHTFARRIEFLRLTRRITSRRFRSTP